MEAKKGYVTVSKTTFSNGLPKDKDVEEKTIQIKPFETTPAEVLVSGGLTIPTGQWSSAKIFVSIKVPCYKEEIVSVYKQVDALVDKMLNKKAKMIQDSLVAEEPKGIDLND